MNLDSPQGALQGVGSMDLINESAIAPYGGWTPQLPEYMTQKVGLDSALMQELTAATGNQETAKAFTKVVLSRLVEDHMQQQDDLRSAMASRGLLTSGVNRQNARDVDKAYERQSGDVYADLAAQLAGISQGLTGSYSEYMRNIANLASGEARDLFDRGLGGRGTEPEPNSPQPKKPKNKKKNKKKKGGK